MSEYDRRRHAVRQQDPDYRAAAARRTREWRERNPERFFALTLARRGVTPEQFASLLAEQGGVCAICQRPDRGRRLAVDHDHGTGIVRGLLCKDCNQGLGLFDDDTERLATAALYLNRARQEVSA